VVFTTDFSDPSTSPHLPIALQDQEADAQVEEELEEAQGPCKVSRQGSGRLSGGNHGSYMSQPPPAARQPGGGMTEQGTLEQQHQEIQEGVPDMQDGQEGPHMQQGDDCTPPGSQQVPSSTDQELGGTQQGPGSTPGSQQAGSQQCNNEQLSSQGSGGESGAVAGLRAKLVKERRLRHQVSVSRVSTLTYSYKGQLAIERRLRQQVKHLELNLSVT
jgi:hypothetical protein